MKKVILAALAALALGTTNVSAQQYDYEKRHEVAVSYGALSNADLFSYLEDAFTVAASVGKVKYENEKFVGTFGVEYFYRVSNLFAVGGIAAYATQSKDIMAGGDKLGTMHDHFFSVMPAVKCDWLRRRHFGMYSKLGLGVNILTDKQKFNDGETAHDATATFAWQLSLVGLEAGSQNVRAFAELGCGEQGMALIGLRCKF